MSEKIRDLFDRTQSRTEVEEITEEDIAAEISAYRRGDGGGDGGSW